MNFEFSVQIFEIGCLQIPDFMKIRVVEAGVLRADRRTDRYHDNRRFSQLRERSKKEEQGTFVKHNPVDANGI